jgi:hypothetical protein
MPLATIKEEDESKDRGSSSSGSKVDIVTSDSSDIISTSPVPESPGILQGRFFSKSGEKDDVSVSSSLLEFEKLETEIDDGGSNESLTLQSDLQPTLYEKISVKDDMSISSSLAEFERLEQVLSPSDSMDKFTAESKSSDGSSMSLFEFEKLERICKLGLDDSRPGSDEQLVGSSDQSSFKSSTSSLTEFEQLEAETMLDQELHAEAEKVVSMLESGALPLMSEQTSGSESRSDSHGGSSRDITTISQELFDEPVDIANDDPVEEHDEPIVRTVEKNTLDKESLGDEEYPRYQDIVQIIREASENVETFDTVAESDKQQKQTIDNKIDDSHDSSSPKVVVETVSTSSVIVPAETTTTEVDLDSLHDDESLSKSGPLDSDSLQDQDSVMMISADSFEFDPITPEGCPEPEQVTVMMEKSMDSLQGLDLLQHSEDSLGRAVYDKSLDLIQPNVDCLAMTKCDVMSTSADSLGQLDVMQQSADSLGQPGEMLKSVDSLELQEMQEFDELLEHSGSVDISNSPEPLVKGIGVSCHPEIIAKDIVSLEQPAIMVDSMDSLNEFNVMVQSADSLGQPGMMSKSVDSLGQPDLMQQSIDSLGQPDTMVRSVDSLESPDAMQQSTDSLDARKTSVEKRVNDYEMDQIVPTDDCIMVQSSDSLQLEPLVPESQQESFDRDSLPDQEVETITYIKPEQKTLIEVMKMSASMESGAWSQSSSLFSSETLKSSSEMTDSGRDIMRMSMESPEMDIKTLVEEDTLFIEKAKETVYEQFDILPEQQGEITAFNIATDSMLSSTSTLKSTVDSEGNITKTTSIDREGNISVSSRDKDVISDRDNRSKQSLLHEEELRTTTYEPGIGKITFTVDKSRPGTRQTVIGISIMPDRPQTLEQDLSSPHDPSPTLSQTTPSSETSHSETCYCAPELPTASGSSVWSQESTILTSATSPVTRGSCPTKRSLLVLAVMLPLSPGRVGASVTYPCMLIIFILIYIPSYVSLLFFNIVNFGHLVIICSFT